MMLKMHHEGFDHLITGTDTNVPQSHNESNATDVEWKALGSEFVIPGSSKHVPWCNGVVQAETWVKIMGEHQRPSDRWTMPMYWNA